MKGYTKIELTDVKTGKVQTVEKHNIVTNGLKEFLRYVPQIGTQSQFTTQNWWQSAIGGMLLFDKALTETVDNIKNIGTATMTGQGVYNNVNTTDVPEMGSYNITESGLQDDGSIKLVYDFTTSQANGTIASVCLTHADLGYAGTGRKSGKVGGWNKSFLHQYTHDNSNSLHPGNWLVYADYLKNKALYYVHGRVMDENEILFIEYDLNLSKARLNNYYKQIDKRLKLGSDSTLISFIGLNTYGRNAGTTYADGYIYLLYPKNNSTYCASREELALLKIKDDFSGYTVQYFVNPTDKSIYTWDNNTLAIYKDYLCVMTTDRKCAIINLKNTTEYRVIDTGENSYCFLDGDMLYFYSKSTNYVYVSNMQREDKTALVTDYKYDYGSRYSLYIAQMANNPGLLVAEAYGYDSLRYIGCGRMCNYLATINNLESPVVKTAAQTMKITYTITFDEEA